MSENYILKGIPKQILTSNDYTIARLKTESGNTVYDTGKIFRAFYELNLSNNATRVFKFEVSGDVDLLSSQIDIDEGGIEYRVYAGGVEGGTFTPLQEYAVNNKSTVTNETSLVKVSTGGAVDVSGILNNDVVRIRAANANSKQATVDSADDNIRGFGAVTAYVVVKSLDGVNGNTTGTIKWRWQNS